MEMTDPLHDTLGGAFEKVEVHNTGNHPVIRENRKMLGKAINHEVEFFRPGCCACLLTCGRIVDNPIRASRMYTYIMPNRIEQNYPLGVNGCCGAPGQTMDRTSIVYYDKIPRMCCGCCGENVYMAQVPCCWYCIPLSSCYGEQVAYSCGDSFCHRYFCSWPFMSELAPGTAERT